MGKKIIASIIGFFLIIYIVICGLLYFNQESLLFFPKKLNYDYQYNFEGNFEEYKIPIDNKDTLSSVLFKADTSKGVILFFHGNAGNIVDWSNASAIFNSLGYDLLLVDYRGYGKSDGTITSQQQLFDDNELIYERLKKIYPENKITVIGYSIGTGLAAKIASDNKPNQLILLAPYYSLVDMMKTRYSLVPTFLLKYRFETNVYLKNCSTPISIFHGDSDEVIYYESSVKLKKELGDKLKFITLKNQRHNGILENQEFMKEINSLLK
jgi:uncharacterized protein